MSFRKDRIKTAIFSKPYYKYFIMIFFAYVIFNIYINEIHVTGSALFHFEKTFLIFFILFNLVVAFLVALSMSLVIMRFKEMKQLKSGKKAGGLAAFGMFAGLIGGACPGCFAGIFPAILGLFGSTGTLGILPFNGLEIQAVTILIIIFSVYMLTKPMTCKVKI